MCGCEKNIKTFENGGNIDEKCVMLYDIVDLDGSIVEKDLTEEGLIEWANTYDWYELMDISDDFPVGKIDNIEDAIKAIQGVDDEGDYTVVKKEPEKLENGGVIESFRRFTNSDFTRLTDDDFDARWSGYVWVIKHNDSSKVLGKFNPHKNTLFILGKKDLTNPLVKWLQQNSFVSNDEYFKLEKGGKINKNWISDALSGGKNKGALRRTALRKGLLRNENEKLSMTDLHKLEKLGGKTAKRAYLAETLRKFDNGGDVEEYNPENDLFKKYDTLPKDVKAVLDKYSELEANEGLDYSDLEKFLSELKPLGYEFDYYLGAEPYNLRKIETDNKDEVYIEFLNKDKGYNKDIKSFKSYNQAVEWARENFERFDPDMIKYYANGGDVYNYKVGDVVYNKQHNTIGIVRDIFDRNDLRTDADGVVYMSDLEIYDKNNPKHKAADIAPSTKKELGNKYENGGEVGGRGWGKFKKGEKISSLKDVKIGEIYLEHSNQFNSNNIIIITSGDTTGLNRDIVYASFVRPNNLKNIEETFAIWGHDLERKIDLYKIKGRKYEFGGNVDLDIYPDEDLRYTNRKIKKSQETLVRENIYNGEIQEYILKAIIGKEPEYPTQIVGSLKLTKCFLRPYYKI